MNYLIIGVCIGILLAWLVRPFARPLRPLDVMAAMDNEKKPDAALEV